MNKNQQISERRKLTDYRNERLFDAIIIAVIGFSIVCALISSVQKKDITRQGSHAESVQVVVE